MMQEKQSTLNKFYVLKYQIRDITEFTPFLVQVFLFFEAILNFHFDFVMFLDAPGVMTQLNRSNRTKSVSLA